jgi:hypothetical protein
MNNRSKEQAIAAPICSQNGNNRSRGVREMREMKEIGTEARG